MEKASSSKGANYKFGQLFGYKGPNEKIMEEDIISVMRFDNTGKKLALGDKAGRVIIFDCPESSKRREDYEYFSEFQSHTREFDPLRSMDIEEEVREISWLAPQGAYLKLLTTNDRTIKLWKVFEKTDKKVVKSAGKELSIPRLQGVETSYISQMQIAFSPKHISAINSVAPACNQQYMLSSDDVQAFLWSF